MKTNTCIPLFIFFLIIVFSCGKKEEKNKTIARKTIANKYQLIENPQTIFPFEPLKFCKNKIYKDLNFEIKFHNNKLLDKNITFLIVADTIIYRGTFKEKICVKNFKICMDDNLSQIFVLDFALIDEKSKKLYQWARQDSYQLNKKKLIKVILDWDNNEQYDISFE